MSQSLRYIPLISFLCKLVLKLDFISSRSPLFFFVHLLQCHQQPSIVHITCLNWNIEAQKGTFLGSSFVKPAIEHNSCLLALHMFGNHLYMCADWWHCYIQRLGLDNHPLHKSTMVYVRDRMPHSSWNRWSQLEENFMLMKLCGIILYMVLRKNFAFLLIPWILWYCCQAS
jgi:hypothetical protein